MTTETSQVDLTRFTDPNYPIGHPWVKGGWRYATDGRVCARVPAPGEPDTEGKHPDAFAIFVSVDLSKCVDPWSPGPAMRKEMDCEQCEGEGLIGRERCEECGGRGDVECSECGQDTECDECDGEGFFGDGEKCPECDGKRRTVQEFARPFGPAFIAVKYERLVSGLPGVRCITPTEATKPIFFVFDGGQGAVMPLNPDGVKTDMAAAAP